MQQVPRTAWDDGGAAAKENEERKMKLQSAKKAGRMVRLRVTGTCTVVGLTLTLLVILSRFFPIESLVNIFGGKLTLLVPVVLLLGVLPIDRRAIRRIGYFLFVTSALLNAAMCVAFVQVWLEPEACTQSRYPRWYMGVLAALATLFTADET